MAKQRRVAVDSRHHLVAALDRQRAARAEVVLDIDDDENVVVADGYWPAHGRRSVPNYSIQCPAVAGALSQINVSGKHLREHCVIPEPRSIRPARAR
jgi:hypothetical protein